MERFNREYREKLGNTIIYLAERIPELSKTKLLKLLYVLEESFVRKYHVPFLDIDFEVWQAGPVNRDVFVELSDDPIILEDYIERTITQDSTIIKAKKAFSGDEFSEVEIKEMQSVVDDFGEKTAAELVAITHQPESAWYYFATKHKLIPEFDEKGKNSSTIKIDLAEYLQLDEEANDRYIDQKEFNAITREMNK